MIFCCDEKYKGLKLHLRPQSVTFVAVDEGKVTDLLATIEKLAKEPSFLAWINRDSNESEKIEAESKLKKLGIIVEDSLNDEFVETAPNIIQYDRNIVFLYGNGSEVGAYGKYFAEGNIEVPNSVLVGIDPKNMSLLEIRAGIAAAVKGENV